MSDEFELLTIDEAARMLRIGSTTLTNWRKQGLGPKHVRTGKGGKTILYLKSDVEDWIKGLSDSNSGLGCSSQKKEDENNTRKRSAEFITEAELAEMLHVSRGTIKCWRLEGKTPPFCKIGRAKLYRRDEVDAWIGKHYRDQ